MTSNGVVALILRFFHRIRLQADYVTVVEEIYNVRKNIVSQFLSSTFGQN